MNTVAYHYNIIKGQQNTYTVITKFSRYIHHILQTIRKTLLKIKAKCQQ